MFALAMPAQVGLSGCAESPAPRPQTVIVAVAGPTASAQAPAPPKEAAPADGPPGEMEKALNEWSPKTQCDDYDYFPKGGIQNFWCHRPRRLSVKVVRDLAGTAIFTSGPHSDDALVLDAKSDFGHYAPGFVRWLVDHAGPSPRGSIAQKATQPMYDRAMRPLARIFYLTHAKATRDPACFDKEKRDYADAMAKKKLPVGYYERWFWFMNPEFCARTKRGAKGDRYYYDHGFDGGVDGNVTKSVVGFWLRRSIDGTMATFAEGLARLVAAYDPEIVERVAGLPRDPAGWGGMEKDAKFAVGASTCGSLGLSFVRMSSAFGLVRPCIERGTERRPSNSEERDHDHEDHRTDRPFCRLALRCLRDADGLESARGDDG